VDFDINIILGDDDNTADDMDDDEVCCERQPTIPLRDTVFRLRGCAARPLL
jgi:hypothetical protein